MTKFDENEETRSKCPEETKALKHAEEKTDNYSSI